MTDGQRDTHSYGDARTYLKMNKRYWAHSNIIGAESRRKPANKRQTVEKVCQCSFFLFRHITFDCIESTRNRNEWKLQYRYKIKY